MSNLVPNSVYAELCAEHGAELAAELAAELRAWQFSTIPLPVPFNTMREIAFAIVFVSCTRPVVVFFCLNQNYHLSRVMSRFSAERQTTKLEA